MPRLTLVLLGLLAATSAVADDDASDDAWPGARQVRHTQVWLGPEAGYLRGQAFLGGSARLSSELPFGDVHDPSWSGSVYALGGNGGGHDALALLIGCLRQERLGPLRYGAGLDIGYVRLSDTPGLVVGPRAVIGLDIHQGKRFRVAIDAHAAVQTPGFYHGGLYLTFWSPWSG